MTRKFLSIHSPNLLIRHQPWFLLIERHSLVAIWSDLKDFTSMPNVPIMMWNPRYSYPPDWHTFKDAISALNELIIIYSNTWFPQLSGRGRCNLNWHHIWWYLSWIKTWQTSSDSDFKSDSLGPARFAWTFKWIILKLILMINQHWFKWWLHLPSATSRYLNQCWSRSISPYGVR